MRVETLTTSGDNALLRGIRSTLADADSALLCVAFASAPGVNRLRPQLRRLRSQARVLVTTVFGSSNPMALSMLRELGAEVRVLNPGSGTYHTKIYLGANRSKSSAVIGSANLTGGLVTNIEAATHLLGKRAEGAIADTWSRAEELWADQRTQIWEPTGDIEPDVLEPELFEALRRHVAREPVVYTLGRRKPNYVREVSRSGLYVETEKSQQEGNEPQLVPAWMIQLAWDYLRAHGELSNSYLLADDGLNVKRSSAVCAILATMPGVEVVPGRKILLRYRAK